MPWKLTEDCSHVTIIHTPYFAIGVCGNEREGEMEIERRLFACISKTHAVLCYLSSWERERTGEKEYAGMCSREDSGPCFLVYTTEGQDNIIN